MDLTNVPTEELIEELRGRKHTVFQRVGPYETARIKITDPCVVIGVFDEKESEADSCE